jgi:hypothetical protein
MPKAVVLTWYGPPDVFVWRDVPMPVPGPGGRTAGSGLRPHEARAVFDTNLFAPWPH